MVAQNLGHTEMVFKQVEMAWSRYWVLEMLRLQQLGVEQGQLKSWPGMTTMNPRPPKGPKGAKGAHARNSKPKQQTVNYAAVAPTDAVAGYDGKLRYQAIVPQLGFRVGAFCDRKGKDAPVLAGDTARLKLVVSDPMLSVLLWGTEKATGRVD
jgi:hypothetical protein